MQAQKLSTLRRSYIKADVILKIEPPTLEEIELMHPGQTLISALQIGHLKVESLQAMLKKKIIALAYEFIEDKVGGYAHHQGHE